MTDRIVNSDPAKLLGLGAIALSVGVNVLFFVLTRDISVVTFLPGTAHAMPVTPVFLHLQFYGVSVLGAIGLLVTWLGWRRCGGVLMALTALGYVLETFVATAVLIFVPFLFAAVVGGAWMGAALAAFGRVAPKIDVSSRGDRLQNRPGTWFTQRGGK
jgi:uncharacterized membrane protein